MSKKFRKLACLLVALVVVLGTAASAFAGTVTYINHDKVFEFEPGSVYSATDLFSDDFKGVMPGDTIRDTVTVENSAEGNVKVEIFMRALGATDLQEPEDGIAEVTQSASADFLKEMNLQVVHRDGRVLFDATADTATGTLEDNEGWVSVLALDAGRAATMDITLTVPADMGNEFQNRIGALDWQFKVNEYPIEEESAGETLPPGDEDPTEPDKNKDKGAQTGDDSNMIVPLSLMGIAALAIILALATRRRKQEQ